METNTGIKVGIEKKKYILELNTLTLNVTPLNLLHSRVSDATNTEPMHKTIPTQQITACVTKGFAP